MKNRKIAYMSILLFLLILFPASNVSAQAPETRGDTDWLPDGKLDYMYVWPGGPPERWVLPGRSLYELTLSVEEKVYTDFKFTYVVNQDVHIGVWILNKMPIGLFEEGGQLKGWLYQFDFAEPPTSNLGVIKLMDQVPFAGAGYWWSQPMKAGDQLVIKGRLVMTNSTATDLAALGLAFSWARLHYSNSYLPVADFITYGNQTLIPNMDLWGALGIPLSKSTVDTIRAVKQQEASFNQEKTKLQTQISDLQKNLSSTQEQVKTLQSDLKSAQDSIKSLQDRVLSLEKDKASLQSEVSTKQSTIDSLESQLSQSQIMLYGSIGAAVILLIVAVVLAVRRRK